MRCALESSGTGAHGDDSPQSLKRAGKTSFVTGGDPDGLMNKKG